MNVAFFINHHTQYLEVHHPECRDIKRKVIDVDRTIKEEITTTSHTILEDALYGVNENWYCGQRDEDGNPVYSENMATVYPCCHRKN